MSLENSRFNPVLDLARDWVHQLPSYLGSREQLLLGLAIPDASDHPLSLIPTKMRKLEALGGTFCQLSKFPWAVSLFIYLLSDCREIPAQPLKNEGSLVHKSTDWLAAGLLLIFVNKILLEHSLCLSIDSLWLLHWSCRAGTGPRWPLSLVCGLSNL